MSEMEEKEMHRDQTWADRVRRWKASGLSAKQFVEEKERGAYRHHLLYTWQKRVNLTPEAPTEAPSAHVVVPQQQEETQAPSHTRSVAVIVTPQGHQIFVLPDCTSTMLRQILGALSAT
jgi:hypothetical protein